MPHHTNPPRRKILRLQSYDYSNPGAYFVTICTHGRECLLGDVVDEKMQLNAAGNIVLDCWKDLANHYERIEQDAFIVMPNHVHGIIVIRDSENTGGPKLQRAGYKPAPTHGHTLSEVVRGFKTFSARRLNQLRNRVGQPVWQRNYYEHVIRNEQTLTAVREYILNNPAKWAEDRENPNNFTTRLR